MASSRGSGNSPDLTVARVLESVDLMLKTKLSKSARAERRACASSAVRGKADPTSAGAMPITVEFNTVAMVSRWVWISGTTEVVISEADNATVFISIGLCSKDWRTH